jgi:1-acyl-sn-glycerol-3-phosphate acyltransferase
MTFLRSALFLAWFFAVTAILSILCLWVLVSRRATQALARIWSRATFFGLRVIAGIDWEIRGTAPSQPVLVASKHMSMWDTLALWLALPAPAIVLKRELLRIPFYGWFLWRGAAIPIDRGAGASALRRMSARAKAALAEGRQVLIFPEGTRKQPGAAPDYKPGVAALYGLLGVPCVPVALNSGVFWQGFTKKPGTIVLEFLTPIPPGLKRADFMRRLEDEIETATTALLP